MDAFSDILPMVYICLFLSCSDAKHMAKNVTETLSSIFIQETRKNAYEAAVLIATLREEKRYIEDVWT